MTVIGCQKVFPAAVAIGIGMRGVANFCGLQVSGLVVGIRIGRARRNHLGQLILLIIGIGRGLVGYIIDLPNDVSGPVIRIFPAEQSGIVGIDIADGLGVDHGRGQRRGAVITRGIVIALFDRTADSAII